jgi:hypothetical protein
MPITQIDSQKVRLGEWGKRSLAPFPRIGKIRTLVGIAFDHGRTMLDYRPCDPATDPANCYVTLFGCYDGRDCPGVPPGGVGYVYATFDVLFR